MTAIAVWLKDLLPRTPALLRNVAAREVRLAAREFFTRSYVWKETVEDVDLVAAQASYTPVPADIVNSEIFAIIAVEFDGGVLKRLPCRPVGDDPTGAPVAWYSPTPGACVLWPTPDVDTTAALRFHVALLPAMASTDVPDFMYQRYYDALIDGSLARIYVHPNKPYTDEKRAAFHNNRFRRLVAQASGDAKGGHNNTQDWRFPPFA